jgi:copper(I)-binding protein
MRTIRTAKSLLQTRWIAGIALALFAGAALANTSGISVHNPRIRLLPGDLPLAGYFDLHNAGKKTVTLVGASCPDFGKVMMHHSISKNGQETMVMVMKLPVAPGKSIHFAPGGYHLMLMKRRHEIKVGQKLPITLKFADGHSLRVHFRVGGATIQ